MTKDYEKFEPCPECGHRTLTTSGYFSLQLTKDATCDVCGSTFSYSSVKIGRNEEDNYRDPPKVVDGVPQIENREPIGADTNAPGDGVHQVTENESSVKRSLISTLGKITAWFAGAILLFFGLLAFVPGDSIPIAGFLFMTVGVFALPPVRRQLTTRMGLSMGRGAVVLIVLVGSMAGLFSIGASYDGENPDISASGNTTTPESEMEVRCWFNDHRGKIRNAEDELTSGMNAFNNGDYSRSLMHLEKAFNKYKSLNMSAHKASIGGDEMERLLEGYFFSVHQGSAAAYSMVYEIQVNNDRDAAERRLESFEQHAANADERRSELKSKLGVEPSTDLTEISADCGVF